MIRYKDKTIRLCGLSEEMLNGLVKLDKIYTDMGFPCVLTSGSDGKHKKGSKHYEGNAVDTRTRMLTDEAKSKLVSRAKAALGDDFDVVLESTHLHTEYDP